VSRQRARADRERDPLAAVLLGHSGQAAAYAIATERAAGLPVREIVIVYSSANAEQALGRGDLPTELVADGLA
jgi:hypothetical protein